jgi:hypothetical protein
MVTRSCSVLGLGDLSHRLAGAETRPRAGPKEPPDERQPFLRNCLCYLRILHGWAVFGVYKTPVG